MAHYRYTINELSKPEHADYLKDNSLLIALINERMSSCTNYHAPLYVRLKALRSKLESKKEQDQ